VHLGLVEKKLKLPHRHYPPSVEEDVTAFLGKCFIELYPAETANEARHLEAILVRKLKPLLNIAHPKTAD
jgi:hypothetical protein